MHESVTSRLIYWFWFSLLLSLAPLGYSIWELLTQQTSKNWWLASQLALSHGELILICIPLLGGAIGELFKGRQYGGKIRTTITGITVILFFFASATFVKISTLAALGKAKDPDDIMITSFTIFMGTLMVGASAIITNKKERSLLGGYYG